MNGRGGPERLRRNPDWYRVRYQLATLYLNAATDGVTLERLPPKELLGEARRQSLSLARDTVRAILEFAREDPRLVDFLRATIEPSALAILAGSIVQGERRRRPPEPRPEPPTRTDIDALLQQGHPDPWRLIAFVRQQPELAPRVLYNLACFYARVGDLDEAATYLERAVYQTAVAERPALFLLIDSDLTLKGLRDDEKRLAAVEKLRPRGVYKPEARAE